MPPLAREANGGEEVIPRELSSLVSRKVGGNEAIKQKQWVICRFLGPRHTINSMAIAVRTVISIVKEQEANKPRAWNLTSLQGIHSPLAHWIPS